MSIPIQVVLRRGMGPNGPELVQQPFTAAERQQLQARYAVLEAGPAAASFKAALADAQQHHPTEPTPLIVLSRSNGDEMTWQILDNNNQPETGFTVSVHPVSGGPPDPLVNFPQTAKNTNIVRSGQPKATHLNQHYKFRVVASDKVEIDPDWYTGP